MLRSVLEAHDISWSVHLGLMYFYSDEKPVPTGSAHRIDKLTGLVGSPSASEQGASIVSHFNRVLAIGDVVTVASDDVNGAFRIAKLEHTGDTFGSEAWLSKIEGIDV